MSLLYEELRWIDNIIVSALAYLPSQCLLIQSLGMETKLGWRALSKIKSETSLFQATFYTRVKIEYNDTC